MIGVRHDRFQHAHATQARGQIPRRRRQERGAPPSSFRARARRRVRQGLPVHRRSPCRPRRWPRSCRSELGKNTVLELALDGKKLLAMIRDFALHPVQRSLEHVDFVEVKLDRRSTSRSPSWRPARPWASPRAACCASCTASCRCAACRTASRSKLETDVTHLELGEHITTQDLKLPEGRHRAPACRADAHRGRGPGEGSRRDAGCHRCGGSSGRGRAGGGGGRGGPARPTQRRTTRRTRRRSRCRAPRRRPRQPRARVRGKPAQRRLPRRRCPARGVGLAGLQGEVQRRLDARRARERRAPRASEAADVHEPVGRQRAAGGRIPEGVARRRRSSSTTSSTCRGATCA